MLGRHGSVQCGNAMAVRIGCRIPKPGRNPLFKAFRDEMLETFRLFVQFFDLVAKHLKQERLDKPVMPDDLQSPPSTRKRQLHTTPPLIVQEGPAFGSKRLQHIGDRSRRQLQPLREFRTADAALLLTAQRVNGFEVVVD